MVGPAGHVTRPKHVTAGQTSDWLVTSYVIRPIYDSATAAMEQWAYPARSLDCWQPGALELGLDHFVAFIGLNRNCIKVRVLNKVILHKIYNIII